MSLIAVTRIQRELRDIIKSEKIAQCGIKAELIKDNLYKLKGEIKGPPDTPYEGGTFELKINLPKNYPFQPPLVHFVTKIWHVNICSETGYVCLDILNDQWAASLSLRTILISIQLLLSSPEPNDPQDPTVVKQFLENPDMFNLTARHWTNVYARGPSKNKSFNKKIRKMIKLGYPANKARTVLSACNWDLDVAINTIDDYYSESDDSEDN